MLPVSRSQPGVVRQELYRGSLDADLTDIEVDPEGRFAIVLASQQGKLYRIEFTDPPTVTDVS